ncbi:NAD(P)/FAD-dependent oxidoreductase [Ensifer soli]|uniref:NAD(P)/FAD-dependent oxidoreductase n=1 Tax=Ciceribacter sp. sgz301302 TaxID=3342379 RepID=UPI0035B804B5
MAFTPYWWEAAPRLERAEPLPAAADVVIVGSGFTGLVAALTLARNGRMPLVLERGAPGFGASTRNGGQVGSGNQKFRVKTLIALRGREKAHAMLREGVAMLDHIAALVEDEGIDCDFTRCGRLRGAMRPEHYEAMARDMDDLRALAGVESHMVPRAEQHREIGSDLFHGGSLLPGDAALHPSRYHAGLMARVEAAGGRIEGDAGVGAIAAEGTGFAVSTARGTVRAGAVLVATNGYTDGLVPELGRRIVPVGSALIATGTIPEARFASLMPGGRVYGNTLRVFSYFRAAPGARRIVWGGRVGRGMEAASPGAYGHLAGDLLKTFPDLGDIPVTHGWDGRIGYTYDAVPHLGRTRDGLFYALGYCGTGISRASWFGRRIALRMLERPEGRSAFDDLPFPAYPLPSVARRMVPVVEGWYRLKDRLGR